MFLGIDCGTQGTKVLLWDAENQHVMATSFHAHSLLNERPGQKEQHPADWLIAMRAGVWDVMKKTGVSQNKIIGIGVSGQQHGLVILDKYDAVLRPAKLWCDTESTSELKRFIEEYQITYGRSLCSDIGIQVPVAFTLGKLLWVKQHESAHYNCIDKLMLPHDYINYFLTGEFRSEPGDASGTGYFNTMQKTWCTTVLELIDPELHSKLPEIVASHQAQGVLRAEAAEYLGLSPGIVVSSGGGDNMMSAIGTGNIAFGQVTMSLGTSGTLSTCQPEQIDCGGFEDINAFCSSTGEWLPLISTMNVTNAINTYRQLMDINLKDFDNYLMASRPGAEGLFTFPWLNGARLPNLPGARGEISGITMVNFTKPHLLRSVVEGVTFNLCKGIEIFNARGLVFDRVSIIGGGANSRAWCGMVADITGLTITRPAVPDAAALGAAIQADWCYRNTTSVKGMITLSTVLPDWLTTQQGEAIEPDPANNEQYRQIYQDYHAEVEQIKKRYLNESIH
ncbi:MULTISPECIES: xylulokinase [unclassified Pantoea]|uniref:xylulokinase n=1 Tax=unclassified Pantoea TaxID=2630326 RepID=UPI001CD78426|nr:MULTISPECIES: xylulokinase [unclassified Pantoea]MCA1179496.1 xylulokinase [Pantoea sp. alder69]MCA1251749.1 xylulokinase [Pantoea sp. alder70]MCA1267914.1 xylulokinase [Pantoea sp. alder81]